MIQHLLAILLLIHLASTVQNVRDDYTVDRANEYIAANKASVNQTYRLRYHAMAPIGWINDPNGFSVYQGEYHLFYQYNPYSAVWDPMHWGHAKSTDLITWQDLPVALAPDQEYDRGGIFSGSAIEKDGKLYLVYTCVTAASVQQQCIAVSEDGVNFEKIPENPVLTAADLPANAVPNEFRDPKVLQRDGKYYIVAASMTKNNTGQILMFESADLVDWAFKSILLEGSAEQGNMWECPDLYELDGKDVLMISPVQMRVDGDEYWNSNSVVVFIGTMDWEMGTFAVESVREVDHGLDFYATQSLLDVESNRRVMIAWMNMWGRNYPTNDLGHKWTGAMTVPRELHVVDGKLRQTPVEELKKYETMSAGYANIKIVDKTLRLDNINGEVGVFNIIANVSETKFLKIILRGNDEEGTELSYNGEYGDVTLNRESSGIAISGGGDHPTERIVRVSLDDSMLHFKVLMDQSSLEVFINEGVETMTTTIYPTKTADVIEFYVDGTLYVDLLTFTQLNV